MGVLLPLATFAIIAGEPPIPSGEYTRNCYSKYLIERLRLARFDA
jgi:hypothetical protein